MSEERPLLEVRGLSVGLGGSRPVTIVKDLSFSIPERMIYGLAGESGCGKSLTALALMGILPKTMHASGSIVFEGRELMGISEDEYREVRGSRMAMVFQEPMTSLNPVLRISYQIEEVINTHLKVTKKEAERISLGLLRAVRIPSPEIRMREYPHQLSGGMRQRVMMAMAIACSPALLVCDEPTTALDVTIEAQILDLIRSLREEKAMGVLLITHDLGVIAENADRVGIMYAGRLVEEAPVADIFRAPGHPYTAGLLASLPTARGKSLTPIPGNVPRPGELPEGCAFSDRCAYALDACRAAEPELTGTLGHLTRCIRAEEAPWRKA
jgi:oligopeptide/dipeptide ABC transporter ATP-binding protein